jgi:hypothetical protein
MTPEERGDHVLKCVVGRRASGNPIPNVRGSWKASWREVGGRRMFFRSRWESNYACYLEWLLVNGQICSWEHECKTFWFEGIKRGVVSYLPDFKVTKLDGAVEWHEVKGWMDDRSRIILQRMAKYHPKEVMVLIREKEYSQIKRAAAPLIPGWE